MSTCARVFVRCINNCQIDDNGLDHVFKCNKGNKVKPFTTYVLLN